jgi:hypothetical protein
LNAYIKDYYFEISKVTLKRWQYIWGFGNKRKVYFFTYKIKINKDLGAILHTNREVNQNTLKKLENLLKEAFSWLDTQNGQILDIEKLHKMLKEEESFLNLLEK